MKTCIGCKKELTLSSFYKDKHRKDGHYPRCKQCQSVYTSNWRKNNTLKARGHYIKHRYGITLEQYDDMLEEQADGCSICMTVFPGGGKKSFFIDHDHKTGKIRGLLCRECNLMIGHAKDNNDTLRAAINYLEKWGR